MALQRATGTLNVTTAAAGNTVVVSGLGFQPTCVIFFHTGRTTTGIAEQTMMRGFGCAISTTERWAVASYSLDGAPSADTGSAHATDACIISCDGTPAQNGAMDLQSFDSGGFTLVIDTQFPADYLVSYLALGGDSLTSSDVAVGTFTSAGVAPVDQTVTVGFQPTGVLFGNIRLVAAPPGTSGDSSMNLGAMDAAGEQANWGGASNDGSAAMSTNRYSTDAQCVSSWSANAASLENQATFVSMNAGGGGGFTINWSARGNATRVSWLALKNLNIKIGSFTPGISDPVNTTYVTSGFGFRPAAVLVVGHMTTESTTGTAQATDALSIGAATSAAQSVQAMTDVDAQPDSLVGVSAATAAVWRTITGAGGLSAEIAVQSFDTDGITYVVTDSILGNQFIWYVALGPAAGTQFNLVRP